LVLKDGRIVEQGTHPELLALDGVFASMWAHQIDVGSSNLPTPVVVPNPLPEAEILGYSVEPELLERDHEVVAEELAVTESGGTLEATLESREPDVVDTTQVSDELERIGADTQPDIPATPTTAAAIAFPASEPVLSTPISTTSPLAAAPLTFPTSDDTPTAQETERPASVQTPGVTFEPSLVSPTTSPDPDAEPKRKRISSQNFQRLARRISLTTRRQGSTSSISSIIPGLKRDKSSADDNSGRGEGSGRNSIDSPTASLSGDKGKGKKKDKKEKRKSSS
jgi:hypothetical protein